MKDRRFVRSWIGPKPGDMATAFEGSAEVLVMADRLLDAMQEDKAPLKIVSREQWANWVCLGMKAQDASTLIRHMAYGMAWNLGLDPPERHCEESDLFWKAWQLVEIERPVLARLWREIKPGPSG